MNDDSGEKKKKKWSLTEWEDKRMRHTSGRICVNVLYCLTTLLLIIMFICFFTDVMKKYDQLKQEKEIEIQAAGEYFRTNCPDYPNNPASYDNCKQRYDLMNKTASNEVTFGTAFGKYMSDNVTGFTDGLEWKTVGILGLLFCLCACGSNCSKFMKNVAEDPT